MYILQEIVLSIILEMYHNIVFTDNSAEIEEIVNKINTTQPTRNFSLIQDNVII